MVLFPSRFDVSTSRTRFEPEPTVWDHVRVLTVFPDAVLMLSTAMAAWPALARSSVSPHTIAAIAGRVPHPLVTSIDDSSPPPTLMVVSIQPIGCLGGVLEGRRRARLRLP